MSSNFEVPGSGSRGLLEIRGGLLARNTVFNLIGLGLPLLIGLLAIPTIIHNLGTDRFGILSLAWVVVGYFGFFDLGLGRATTKYVAEALGKGDMDKVPAYLWTTVFFQAGLSFAGGLLFMSITPWLAEKMLKIPVFLLGETKTTFYLLALSLPFVLISASFRGVLEAAQRFDLVNAVKIPSSSLNYLFPLAGALLGMRLPGIMALLVAARGLTLLAWGGMCLWVLPVLKRKIEFHKETVKPLLSFGGWVTVSNLLAPVLASMDRIMIGSLIAVDAVSYYSAPFEVVMRLGILPGSLLLTLFPMFSAMKGDKERLRSRLYYSRSVKYLLILLGAIVIFLNLFAGDLLRLWLGGVFAEKSTVIFKVLALGFLLNSLAMVPFGLLQGIGRADIPAKFQLIEIVIFVPLTWGMIKTMGIDGAAWAWTLRAALDMVLLFTAAAKVGRIGISDLARNRILRILTTMSVLMAAGSVVLRLPSGRVLAAGLCVAFVPVIWLYYLDPDERQWAKKTVLTLGARKAVNSK